MNIMFGKGKKLGVALLAIVLVSAVALTGCGGVVNGASTSPSVVTASAQPVVSDTGTQYDENTVVALYERAIPAVVQINVTINSAPRTNLPFGFNVPSPQQQGQGSGFIVDTQGHILTNNHVIDGASDVKIILHTGSEVTAKVLGTDQANDIALLQADISKLNGIAPLTLGDSDKVKPGQTAIALGSPYGLEGSITVGIVSGLKRSIPSTVQRQIANVIQTDAAINPGNSGGPLLNSKGEVVGINAAIEAQANSIGYAIPINTAKARLSSLISGEQVKSPWLGVEGTALTSNLSKTLGLSTTSGVYVTGVTSNGPAQKAGLIAGGRSQQGVPNGGGDIITAIDNINVTKVEDLLNYFNTKKPGDTVALTVVRDGKPMTIDVTLGEWPSTAAATQNTPPQDGFNFGPFQLPLPFGR